MASSTSSHPERHVRGNTESEPTVGQKDMDVPLKQRLIAMSAWMLISLGAFFYLSNSATGDDGLSGYLPAITAVLLFGWGSQITLNALAARKPH